MLHTISINHHKFMLETSSTDAERRKGLMYRRSLKPQHGMLFFFSKGEKTSMWMKNTYIPLDMLFISPEKIIVCIIHNTKPHSLKLLSCPAEVMAVIEINAGETQKYAIHEGMTVTNLPQTILHLYN
jgi:uncharacterized membrane protein (UPF0127 family)